MRTHKWQIASASTLPDYKSVTEDIDVYIKAWRRLAEPIERELGLTLTGYDPVFTFTKGSPHSNNTTSVQLPVWFVRDLSEKLGYLQLTERQ